MDRRLIGKLSEREAAGTLRSLQSPPANSIDFCSNDYLGLAKTSFEITHSGGTGSRLISGTTEKILEAEKRLAHFFGAESALMFNSGYDANLGFFSSVPQRGDLILYDEFIHASIRDGIRLSFATAYAFKHNNIADIEAQLKKAKGTVYVAIESLYSMDGDYAPLEKIAKLCERYNAWLVVDEAHAAGIFGQDAKGLAFNLNSSSLLARLLTFGKAYGSHGACWLGSENLTRFLYNFARSFIYTTALPEEVYLHNAAIVENPVLAERREALLRNVELFRSLVKGLPLRSQANSPIQIIEAGSVKMARGMADECQRAGIHAKAIFSPTVPIGKECIRVCLHSFNTHDDIQLLVDKIMHAQYTNGLN